MTDNDNKFLKEDIRLRHYFARKEMEITPDETEKALARLHTRIEEPTMKRGREFSISWRRGFGYGFAASLLILIGVGLYWHLHRQDPVTIWMADTNVSRNVTLQCANGDFVIMDNIKDSKEMDELEGSLSEDGCEIVYDKDCEASAQILSTPPQRSFKVTLSDGTRVVLNANSRLAYPSRFTGDKRVVHLMGEAYFEVAKDAQHPFIVKTEQMSTEVLGTQFNVRSYSPSDIHVTLIDGSVQVNANNGNKAMLKPGFDASLDVNGELKVAEVDTDIFCSWKEGFFYFDNESMADVAREIGRWYNVNVVFSSQKSLSTRVLFSASRESSLQEVVELLNSIGKARFSLQNNELHVE